MKKALCTLQIGPCDYFQYTEYAMKAYAKKIGADYIAMTECTVEAEGVEGLSNKERACLQKLAVESLFDRYNRVLFLDADVLVLPDAPDIFEAYPDTSYSYLWNEGTCSDPSVYLYRIFDVFGDVPDWKRAFNQPIYYNTGVMLLSKSSSLLKNISPEKTLLATQNCLCFEQCYFNLVIQKENRPIGDLSPQFNFTALSQAPGLRREPYFIHYAGTGFGPRGTRSWQIIWDYYKAYRHSDEPSVSKGRLLKSGFVTACIAPKYVLICVGLRLKELLSRESDEPRG